jgi:adenylate kinase family enzyme
MKKIVIIGSPGSGKSTLAIKLKDKLNLPTYHLDAHFHKPNWEPRPKEEWDQFLQELVKKDSWIIDGNYQGSLETRLKQADTIIFLDYPKYLCTYRALKRRFIYRNKDRIDRAPGCEEKLSFSFIKFILTYPRDDTLNKINSHKANKQIFIHKSPKQTKQFIDSLAQGV